MPVLQYIHLDVFTDQPLMGNQLAVFLDAAGIDERRMQRIAHEIAFHESTVVLPPADPGTAARVRIFTQSRELPMAGHPTIGTAFALAGAGRLCAGTDEAILGLGIGPTTVRLEWGRSGLRFAWMRQVLPPLGPVIADTVAVAAAIGVRPSDLAGGDLPIEVASSGVPFLYIPLKSRAAVDLEELPVFVFSPEPADDDATVYSRMFAPVLGVPEDPATGGASGPLGAYLFQHNAVSADAASRLVSLQGVRMGRPSRIYISLSSRAGVLEEVRVGGEAVVVGDGTIRT